MDGNRKISAKILLMNTLENLLHKKTFQKISVNELCETALISRSAFYANFDNKYDLLARCLESKAERVNTLMRTHSPEEFLTVVLNLIQQEERFFYNTFGSEPDQEVFEIFYSFFEYQFTSLLNKRQKMGMALPGPIEVVSSFCVGGLTISILRWIKSGYKIPKEELAACQHKLLNGTLQ